MLKYDLKVRIFSQYYVYDIKKIHGRKREYFIKTYKIPQEIYWRCSKTHSLRFYELWDYFQIKNNNDNNNGAQI